ncbi:uncharacterized protein An11g07200 [Aspergillus niger]|uniref:Contig An11c0250, genomic contig n=2 Tax=Aspergillus niger TaxID=5061 RepID=A2QX14_ASPNC|nr:uncharacterized protein An11g07200 [Aspergillus niger]CAK40770.1 unnamed protein product [Aspergillus niger]
MAPGSCDFYESDTCRVDIARPAGYTWAVRVNVHPPSSQQG